MASVNLGSAGQRLWPSQLCVDLVPTPGVDLCCDVHALPFADDSLDCVMATSLLEHLEAPARCAAEVARCLRPGGELYVEVPWLYEVHAYPLDFQRWTLAGLRALFRGMEVVGQGPCEGPACTLARVTRGFVASLFRNRVLYYGARTAMTWLLFWCKYLDALVPEENRAAFAMGFWFRARKP